MPATYVEYTWRFRSMFSRTNPMSKSPPYNSRVTYFGLMMRVVAGGNGVSTPNTW